MLQKDGIVVSDKEINCIQEERPPPFLSQIACEETKAFVKIAIAQSTNKNMEDAGSLLQLSLAQTNKFL